MGQLFVCPYYVPHQKYYLSIYLQYSSVQPCTHCSVQYLLFCEPKALKGKQQAPDCLEQIWLKELGKLPSELIT